MRCVSGARLEKSTAFLAERGRTRPKHGGDGNGM
jgi:hypothetical protein